MEILRAGMLPVVPTVTAPTVVIVVAVVVVGVTHKLHLVYTLLAAPPLYQAFTVLFGRFFSVEVVPDIYSDSLGHNIITNP